MDKKSTVAIVILFTMIIIGSIVYTIFSVVKTDTLNVDKRASVIKEEMVSMKQSIDEGNITSNKDKDKNKEDNMTANSTVDKNQYPNNITDSNKNETNQNTTNDNTTNDQNGNSTVGDNTTAVEKPDNGGSAEEEPAEIIKNSIFKINTQSSFYKEGMRLEQPIEGNDYGHHIYVYVDETLIVEDERLFVPIWVEAPESYPLDKIKYYGQIGELEYKRSWMYGNLPITVFQLEYSKDSEIIVQFGWVDGGVRSYTIHFV